jgi:farnesol dehydrogenase
MKSFITGGTGFIGRELLKDLLNRGEEIHLITRRPIAEPIGDKNRVRVFPGDLLDAESIQHAMEGCDRVYHLAGYARNWARDPQVYDRVNIDGTRNVLQSALLQSIRRVVVTSTIMTLGPSNDEPITESTLPVAPGYTHYERSKYEAEKLALSFVKEGLEVMVVNPTRVFGPGLLNEGNSATRMIKWYLEGKWRFILGDGTAIGNYAFVRDVVLGHIAAMERGQPGERYILGGENLSYNEFFETLNRVSGRRHALLHLPRSLALGVGHLEELRSKWLGGYPGITPPWVRTFLIDWACSTEKAERDLEHRTTPFPAALKQTVDWIIDHEDRAEAV